MDYVFTPATAARLNTGNLVQPATKTGKLLPAARDPVTGEFVEIAKIFYPSTTTTLCDRGVLGLLAQLGGGGPLQPLIAPVHVTVAPLQLAQSHQGFQKIYRMLNCLKINLAVMQATAAVIGIGAVSNTVLSAVNLDQVLKIREEAKHQKLKIKDGFIDLRHILKDKGVEVIQQIFKVAHDSNFEMHRQKLVNGYDIFSKAIKRCQSALTVPDLKLRNSEINKARDMLFEALKIYDNPGLLEGLCSAGGLRQMECVWAIELALGITFQLQRAYDTVSDRLLKLQSKIRHDLLTVVKGCQLTAEPSLYQSLKQKSHFLSLRDQLAFALKPELRRGYEFYVCQQAIATGYSALAASNWQEISDLTVANLYYFFQSREDSTESYPAEDEIETPAWHFPKFLEKELNYSN
ncbi:MAG: hypothetical protein EAZ79_02130 [Oscillatoriales cyanobacterium]|nr:MAG: hypothetical protein EAZ79_02130 [Oscillatoriales cyanobacterium]